MQRLRATDWLAVACCIPAYVLLSSWFGLTRDSMFGGNAPMGNASTFFGSVWQANIGADIIFALGSAAVGFGALIAVASAYRNLQPALAGLVALGAGALSVLLNWLVYGLSYVTMIDDWARKNVGSTNPSHQPFGESMHFVWDWGWPGLVWVTGLFPLAYAAVRSISASARQASTPPGMPWLEHPPARQDARRPPQAP